MVSPQRAATAGVSLLFSFIEQVKLLLFLSETLTFCTHARAQVIPHLFINNFPQSWCYFNFRVFCILKRVHREIKWQWVTVQVSCHNCTFAGADDPTSACRRTNACLNDLKKAKSVLRSHVLLLQPRAFENVQKLKGMLRGKPVFQWSLPAIWCLCLEAPPWQLIKKVCLVSGTASSALQTNFSACSWERIWRMTW